VDLRERSGAVRRHPWEVARARFFRTLVAEHTFLPGVRRVLDVGAGDGWFAGELDADLPQSAEVVCWDVNYRSEDLRAPTGRRVTRTATAPTGPFDIVLVLDVLEHVADAEAFLADAVVPALGPNGILVVSVPAHPILFCGHDRMLRHVRRYRPVELRSQLSRHVDIVGAGSLFTTLLVPRAATVVAERLRHLPEAEGVGAWKGGRLVTAAVTGVLDVDARAGGWLARHGWRVPGLSTWAVARRRPAGKS